MSLAGTVSLFVLLAIVVTLVVARLVMVRRRPPKPLLPSRFELDAEREDPEWQLASDPEDAADRGHADESGAR